MTDIGDILYPFHSLKAALENTALQSGQTVFLRSGTHTLSGDTNLTASGITVNPYPGETAVIDLSTSDLIINGANVRFENIELMSSDTVRQSAYNGDVLPDILRGTFTIYGANVEMVGLRIHDLAGVGWWANGAGGLLDSCDLYNCGALQQNGTGWNHLCYTQNSSGLKTIRNCIFGPTFAFGIHAYGAVGQLKGYRISNSVMSHARQLMGGLNGADDFQVDNCAMWETMPGFGYNNNVNGALQFTNNYGFAGSSWLQIDNWQDVTVTNNELSADGSRQVVHYPHAAPTLTWDNNDYRGTSAFEHAPSVGSFAAWQAAGYDASGTYNAPLATANVIRIYPCNGGGRLAHIAVFNWHNDDTVSLDLSSLSLANGNYKLRNAYDPLVDIRTFTYSGSPYTVDMTTRTIAKPIGHALALATVDKRFGAWILEAA